MIALYQGENMQLVSQSSISEVISEGLALGADFVDVFIEEAKPFTLHGRLLE